MCNSSSLLFAFARAFLTLLYSVENELVNSFFAS